MKIEQDDSNMIDNWDTETRIVCGWVIKGTKILKTKHGNRPTQQRT